MLVSTVILTVIILALVLFLGVWNWLFYDPHIVLCDQSHSDQLTEFEERLNEWYPFNSDRFTIRHSSDSADDRDDTEDSDYRQWFYEGPSAVEPPQVKIYAYVVDDKIVGTIGCVLQKPCSGGMRDDKIWYLCDLKVDPKYRGQGIVSKMYWAALPTLLWESRKFYGIVMEPNDRMSGLTSNFWLTETGKLFIYSLDYDALGRAAPSLDPPAGLRPTYFDIIKDYFSKSYETEDLVWVSSSKQLILESTGEPIKVLHLSTKTSLKKVQPEVSSRHPQPGYAHYFCLSEGILSTNSLKSKLSKLGIEPIAKATIYSYGTYIVENWEWIQTHEI